MRERRSARFVTLELERLETRDTPTAGLQDWNFGINGLVQNAAGNDAAAVIVQNNSQILVGGDVIQRTGPVSVSGARPCSATTPTASSTRPSATTVWRPPRSQRST